MDDDTLAALGKLSEALEVAEFVRGLLYEFHRRSGTADLTLQEAVRMFRDAGHAGIADELDEVLVGRDVIGDRWTFQVVESYDTQYWSVFRAMESRARERLGNAPPHIFEAEMKVSEQRADAPVRLRWFAPAATTCGLPVTDAGSRSVISTRPGVGSPGFTVAGWGYTARTART